MKLCCGIQQTLSKAQMQHHMNCTLEPENTLKAPRGKRTR